MTVQLRGLLAARRTGLHGRPSLLSLVDTAATTAATRLVRLDLTREQLKAARLR